MKVLGFPAIFYIVRKKDQLMFLPEGSVFDKSTDCHHEALQEQTKGHVTPHPLESSRTGQRDTFQYSNCNPPSRISHDFNLALKIVAVSFLLSKLKRTSQYETCSKMLSIIGPQLRRLPQKSRSLVAMYSSDPPAEGSIRQAGGAFADKERAHEAAYFNKLQHEQLAKLRGHLENTIQHHEEEIKRHQEAIEKLKVQHKAAESK